MLPLLKLGRSDELDIVTACPKDPSVPRVTYSTAQKMRAAISHKFSREYGLGMESWTVSPTEPGKWHGNPSLLNVVSQYMISLHRQKVGLVSSTT